MLLKVSLLSALLLSSAGVMANEKPECGSAVDAADRLSPASDEGCDYTKTGLNGALHKALSGKTDKTDGEKAIAVKDANEQSKLAVNTPANIGKGEFSSAQQLSALRFSLLSNAAIECPKGFMLDSERYIPTAKNTIKLEFIYRCL